MNVTSIDRSAETVSIQQSVKKFKPETEMYKKSAIKSKISNVVNLILGVIAITALAALISFATLGAAIVPIVAGIVFGATTLGSIAIIFGKILGESDAVAYKDEQKALGILKSYREALEANGKPMETQKRKNFDDNQLNKHQFASLMALNEELIERGIDEVTVEVVYPATDDRCEERDYNKEYKIG